MSFATYLRIARDHWVTVVVVILAAVAASTAALFLTKPSYTASAKVYVGTNSASTITDLTQAATYTQQLVSSYADVATTPIVLDGVIHDLHLRTTASDLARNVSVVPVVNSVVLQISVTDKSPVTAAAVANSTATHLAQVVTNLTPRSSAGDPLRITTVQSAIAPAQPIGPGWVTTLLLASVLGLVVGYAVALIQHLVDTRVRSIADLEALTDAPLLGAFAYEKDDESAWLQSGGRRAEEFRTLRVNLQFVARPSRAKTIVFSSAVPGEGKTTTVVDLGRTLSQGGARTLLVDADLRRPRLASYLGQDGSLGLTDVLIGNVALNDALQATGNDRLTALPAGTIPPNPNELLQSEDMRQLLMDAGEQYDYVLIDSPPLLAVADASVLAEMVTGVILVVGAGRVRRGQVRLALRRLEQISAPVLGLVGNLISARRYSEQYGYGYGYGYDVQSRVAVAPGQASTAS